MSQLPTSKATVSPTGDPNPHRPAGDQDEIYYEGSPQVRGHLGNVLMYTVIGVAVIAIPVIARVYLHMRPMPWWLTVAIEIIGIGLLVTPIMIVKRTRYRITNYRIDYERGWLNTDIDTLELWHVEDIKFHQSLFERIMDVGTIEIFSHDDTTPNLYMRGIPHARLLFQKLEQRIIAVKRQQGVLKVDSGT